MIVASIPITFKSGRAADLLGHMTETGREYEFVPDITLPEGCSAAIEIVKPDGMFVIAECSIVDGNIIVTLPAQALVVRGLAHYIIRITTADDKIIFSAAGSIWVDDALITNEMLESISEVYGLTFPDDFLTTADLANYVTIDDLRAALSDYALKTDIIDVAANPSGAAAADLAKIKIGSEIYKIPDAAVTKTASGNPIEISDGANAPLVKCVTQITGYQSGTGTPSPSNIRPITAYTENTTSVVGRNIYNPRYNNGADGNYFQFYGLHTAGSSYKDRGTVFQAGRTYRITVDIGTSKQFGVYGARKNSSSQIEISGNTTKKHVSVAFTPEVTDKYVFWLYSSGGWSGYTTDNVTLMIENGDTEHEYEPYNPDSNEHTTTYPFAIYRGSEDVVNGTVGANSDGEMWVVKDLGDYTWSKGGTNRFFTNEPLAEHPAAASIVGKVISEWYVAESASAAYSGVDGIAIGDSAEVSQIYVCDFEKASMTGEQFKAAVTGCKFAFALADKTPTSVTPTNLPVKSLNGYSHIESSTGEMEIEYITQMYQPIIDLIS